MRPHSSDWIINTLHLRCFREMIGEESYRKGMLSLISRARDSWQPDEKMLYQTTMEQQRRLSADRPRIKSIFTGFDNGTAGDAAEECWADLLRLLLPKYNIVVKGVIGGIGPVISPQIDILVLNENYPVHLLKSKIYPIDSVVAAFECKLSLRLDDIKEAVSTARRLNDLASGNAKDPITEIPVFYGVLALSCDIENKFKSAHESVLDALVRHSAGDTTSLSMVDSVLSIDNFCLTGTRTIFCYDVDDAPMDMTFNRTYEFHDRDEIKPADSYLGLFIQKLLTHLEKTDPSLNAIRKMYDLFTRYPLEERTITSEDLSNFLDDYYIKKIASNHYFEKTTTFSIVI
ncbi:DUF6602 domain-containing protein [Pseudomonas sp. PSKL.D1]|uniref:DUF6602 domain-containing protein n=1 Tax=Pseudomonas sp. PSKL.D1 TaxID=3029060 RepID=UPI002380ECDC|nr:DUF6602 domain-containing protein [Pseudomonas sp. PSKL.D1]WDY59088.1 hypothetical protein PVV54_05500 [Pseudomonas sp. PSKL.D1]